MNGSVLYLFISRQLHTHVRIYDKNGGEPVKYTNRLDLADAFIRLPEVKETLTADLKYPALFSFNSLISYMTVPVTGKICVIGPVSVCYDSQVQKQFPMLVIPNEFIQKLYPADSETMLQIGVFLYNLFADVQIDYMECFKMNSMQADAAEQALRQNAKQIFFHEEYGNNHNPYDHERREMESIREGDLERLKRVWKEDFSGQYGCLSHDKERNAKYLSISAVILASRAAIQGGVPYELSYSLCDTFCQQIDSSNVNYQNLNGLVKSAQLAFARLASDQKNRMGEKQPSEPPILTRAKDCIFSNLHGKLTVSDVASKLNIHPNYLNKIFRKYTGLTAHEFILREKVNLARNMLIYSEYSYSEIAGYLGFSSQSHLGTALKKITGMTMKQYRDTYKKA